MIVSICVLLALLATGLIGHAQTPGGQGFGGRGPAIVSPQVNADHTFTLRFRAPNAKEVVVIGENDGKEHLMTKGDDGVWTVTIGPLVPDVYNYQFRVDGVIAMDPQNPSVKLGFWGLSAGEHGGNTWRRPCL
jgi:hypothetical protein